MPELSVGSRPGGASASLLGHVRPSLYRINAYRLTGLPFEAGSEQVIAAMRTALTSAKAPLPPVPALTPSELAAVASRQLDTQTLLLDEFFWLWPRPTSKDGEDNALEALTRGAWLDAVDFWRVQCQQRAHDGVALHNIAVLFHMMALDLESLGEVGPARGRQTKERDVWWKEAFRGWQLLHDHSPFWQLYTEKLTGRFSDNSHVEFVEPIRVNLLPAIARVHGHLAAERCSGEEAWDRQIVLIAATGYPAADTVQARRIAVEPFGRAIRAGVSEATSRTKADTRQGLVEAARLIGRGRGWLPFFTKASLPTLKQIERLARGPSARDTIQGYLKAVSGNALVGRATVELDGLSKKLQAIVGAAAPAEDRFAQMRSLIDTSPPLGDEPDYLEARGDLFANWLQQLALRVNNEDEKYPLAMAIVRLALTLSKDTEVRQKLVDAQKSIGRNADSAAVAMECKGITSSPASNADKLRQLEQCAQNQLQLLKGQHDDDPGSVGLVSDIVAGVVRSVATDLSNNDREFEAAVKWLRFAASIARGTDLRQRLAEDLTTGQGLVDRLGASLPPPSQDGSKPRGYWTSCGTCSDGILAFSHRDSTGRVFCSRVCLEWFNGPRSFCSKCVAETTDESSGGLSQFNGIGDTFMGSSHKCPTCASVVRRKVVTAVWLPVFPQSRYRLLYSSPTRFYSRRLK